MEFSVSLPLDDGFLRRECPACELEFKWFFGATETRPDDEPEPEIYYCPYCGRSAPVDHWWTREQLDYAQADVAGPISDAIGRELESAFRGIKGVEFKRGTGSAGGRPPLVEPNDMIIVEPPCHPWEPLKVREDWVDKLHCLLCGSAFYAM